MNKAGKKSIFCHPAHHSMKHCFTSLDWENGNKQYDKYFIEYQYNTYFAVFKTTNQKMFYLLDTMCLNIESLKC